MADLVVIVPSRSRPHAVAELADAFASTCTADTDLLFAVDADDPTLDEYGAAARASTFRVNIGVADVPSNMVKTLNQASKSVVDLFAPRPFAVGFMGDDHRPRTVGWDAAYLEVLRDLGTGLVYGDDLFQRSNIPTQVAMTADIVVALGWMAPPPLVHLYVDNFWRDLGQAAGCLRYLPDTVVEHMHPVAGKAEWDEGHRRVNDPGMYHVDRAAYERFRADGHFAAAVDAVLALRTTA